MDVLIIGGGISGLSALHRLARTGADVALLESRDQSGGVIRTMHDEIGALVELGPNSFQMKEPALVELIEDLGLESELVEANAAASRRYIVRNGAPEPVPMSPGEAFKSRLFSRSALLRLLREPFISRYNGDDDESVASFVERRLGREILDYAVNPFVSGIYAGRPEQLSIRHAFPRLEALEQEFGSLLRGGIGAGRKRARERKKNGEPKKRRAPLTSFRDGMQTLPRAIEKRWSDKIRMGTTAGRIERDGSEWIVHSIAGDIFRSTRLILSVEAYTAARLLEHIDPALASALRRIEYPPVTTAVSIYDRTFVAHPLDGFGMLVPEVERRSILGVIFSSTLFPNRAPDGTIALTTFLGGSRQPEIAMADDETIARTVQIEHEQLLGVSAPPVSFTLHRWPRAIPQYTLGYGKILGEIDRAEAEHPGLQLIANYRGGVAVGDRVGKVIIDN